MRSEQLKAHMADDTHTLTHAPDGHLTPAAPPGLHQKKVPRANLFVRALQVCVRANPSRRPPPPNIVNKSRLTSGFSVGGAAERLWVARTHRLGGGN